MVQRMVVHCKDEVRAALAFARAVGKAKNFLTCLRRLVHMAAVNGEVVHLSADFTKYGFYFEFYPDSVPYSKAREYWKMYRRMNGGVIYHGPLENGRGQETFSVTLTPEDGWAIHT